MPRLFSLYFTSFWILHFHIFWILHFHIFCILHFHIFCILHFHIFCILHFHIFWILHFHIFWIFELLYSSFFPSEFPSLCFQKYQWKSVKSYLLLFWTFYRPDDMNLRCLSSINEIKCNKICLLLLCWIFNLPDTISTILASKKYYLKIIFYN